MQPISQVSKRERLPGILRPIDLPVGVAVIGLAALAAVLVFGLLLSKSLGVTAFDLGFDRSLNAWRIGAVTWLAHAIYLLLSPPGAIGIMITIGALIWTVSKRGIVAGTFLVAVGLSWLSSDIVKMLVHRSRPAASSLMHPYLPAPRDASFPSGHVVFAASMALAFVFLARQTARRPAVIALGIAGTCLVAFAVLYLGVHYPTDVIASIVWSSAAVPLVLTLWHRFVISRWRRSPSFEFSQGE